MNVPVEKKNLKKRKEEKTNKKMALVTNTIKFSFRSCMDSRIALIPKCFFSEEGTLLVVGLKLQ